MALINGGEHNIGKHSLRELQRKWHRDLNMAVSLAISRRRLASLRDGGRSSGGGRNREYRGVAWHQNTPWLQAGDARKTSSAAK